jgi:type III secretion system (T3SS) protein YscO
MRPTDNLRKLLQLRSARLQRAEGALTRQNAECRAARAAREVAAARVVTHRDRQRERETTLLDGLLGRAVTLNDIERVRTAFAVLDEQGADLERAEGEARQSMRAAFEAKRSLTSERDRRRREQDKMSALVSQAARLRQRRDLLRAEAEQEDRPHRTACWDLRRPC